jgi:heptosyltransferase-2
VLAIRLQALGDVVITLPYLQALKRGFPDTQIDLLTRNEDAELPRAVRTFRRVDGLAGGRSERLQLIALALRLPQLLARRYDVVIDLQNNRVSRAVRRALRPPAWSTFDPVSPTSAGTRTRNAIEAAGFSLGEIVYEVPLVRPEVGRELLCRAGWNSERPLVILSPSGAFPTRNWPIGHYAEFVRIWRERHLAQFVVLGLRKIAAKTAALRALVDGVLDLVGTTSASEAMAIVQQADLVVTEDCGLMHMAWTSGVPTLALFGSSRYDWSAPLGEHSLCLHSGDLQCGACMAPTCRFGDVHCLTRYGPEQLAEHAEHLLHRIGRADAW